MQLCVSRTWPSKKSYEMYDEVTCSCYTLFVCLFGWLVGWLVWFVCLSMLSTSTSNCDLSLGVSSSC